MIENLFANPAQVGRFLGIAIVVGVFVYIIILAFLQVRQIRILQEKVQTDADGTVRVITYVYLVFQLILFVIALLYIGG